MGGSVATAVHCMAGVMICFCFPKQCPTPMIQSGQLLLNTMNKAALATVAYGRLLWAQRIGQIAKEEK